MEKGKSDIAKLENYVAEKAGGRGANPTAGQTAAKEPRKYTVGAAILHTSENQPQPVPAATAATTMPYHQLSCPHGDLLTFWQRTTEADRHYVSPFLHHGPEVKYVTFEPGMRSLCSILQPSHRTVLLNW